MKKILLFSLVSVTSIGAMGPGGYGATMPMVLIGPFQQYNNLKPNDALKQAINNLDPQGMLEALQRGANPQTQGINGGTALNALAVARQWYGRTTPDAVGLIDAYSNIFANRYGVPLNIDAVQNYINAGY